MNVCTVNLRRRVFDAKKYAPAVIAKFKRRNPWEKGRYCKT